MTGTANTTNTTKLYQSIHAQPGAIQALLHDWVGPTQAAEQLFTKKRIFLSGIGTSYHAAQVGEYLFRFVGVDAWAVRSFELVHYPRLLHSDDAVIVISHRGSKLQGTLALQRTQEAGIFTLGITGKSSKMQGANMIIETVEQDPSSTHSISYTSALTRIGQIAIRLGTLAGRNEQAHRLQQELERIPELIQAMLASEEQIQIIAQDAIAQQRRIYFVGAGPNAPTATEGALKAKESAYITAEGFELEQAIHGPQTAFEPGDLVIPISVKGPAQNRLGDFLLAQSEIGTHVWLIGEVPTAETAALFAQANWSRFALTNDEDLLEELTPLLAVVPLQLLSDFLAAARGTNADSFRLEHEAYKRAGARFQL